MKLRAEHNCCRPDGTPSTDTEGRADGLVGEAGGQTGGMTVFSVTRILVLAWALSLSTGAVHCFGTCRQDPSATSLYCGLPYILSNFQGYFACGKAVQVGRPSTKEQLLDLIKAFPKVRGVGVGHSWVKQFFCAGDTTEAIDIVLTELTDTKALNADPLSGWLTEGGAAKGSPIVLDEDEETVTVEGGVQTRVLLDYLANAITVKQPLGWTLPTFSWYIDQTIAGAVSTATHGSTLKYGSMSNMVLEVEVALANGTLAIINGQSHPHLFRALQAGVGRLGIITRLKLPIVPQAVVKRSLDMTSIDEFAKQLTQVQEDYVAAKAAGTAEALQQTFLSISEVQAFLFPQLKDEQNVWRVSYQRLGAKSVNEAKGLAKITDTEAYYKSLTRDGTTSGPGKPPGAFSQGGALNITLGPSVFATYLNASQWGLMGKLMLAPLVTPGFYSARSSYLTQADYSSWFMSDLDPYDQYEVSVPLEIAGTCLTEANALWKSGLGEGFRVPALLRFVNKEDPYLAMSHGGPRMYINMEDHVSHSLKKPNVPFETQTRFFVEKCQARLHWGKAGWDWLQPCFDGAALYDKWCDFGCAVQELDPTAKFSSMSNAFVWRATLGGADVPLSQCCSPTGFSSDCACAPRTDMTGCPPAGTQLHINAD